MIVQVRFIGPPFRLILPAWTGRTAVVPAGKVGTSCNGAGQNAERESITGRGLRPLEWGFRQFSDGLQCR